MLLLCFYITGIAGVSILLVRNMLTKPPRTDVSWHAAPVGYAGIITNTTNTPLTNIVYYGQDTSPNGYIDVEKGLQYSDNDPVFYRELLDMFTEEAPGSLEWLTDALAAGNTALYRTLVHGLKNNAQAIGADAAADICRMAEQTAQEGDLDKLNRIHGRVCSIITQTAQAAHYI